MKLHKWTSVSLVAAGALLFLVGCSVSVQTSPDGDGIAIGITLGNTTHTFTLGTAGVFEVKADGVAVAKAAEIPLFEGATADTPSSAAIELDLNQIEAKELTIPKLKAAAEGILTGSATAVIYIAGRDSQNPCEDGINIGTFGITFADGAPSLDQVSLELPREALAYVLDGTFRMCIEMSADFDATITIGSMNCVFGPSAEPDSGNRNDNTSGDDDAGGDDGDDDAGGNDNTGTTEDTHHVLRFSFQGQGSAFHSGTEWDVFDDGELATITADPADGWVFDRWEGDYSSTGNPASFTITSDMNITVVFVEQGDQVRLTAELVGVGCADPASALYNEGDTATINVTPGSGWAFDHWDDFLGNDASLSILMDADKNVTGNLGLTDPVWSTYVGGTGSQGEDVRGMAVDGTGNTYITGTTESTDMPAATNSPPADVWWKGYVSKISASGSVVWTTYLGGSNNSQGNGIAVDGAGNVYITGTGPEDLPAALNDGRGIFVGKLGASSGALQWTYYVGYDSGNGNAIEVDAAGHIYVAGDVGDEVLPNATNTHADIHGVPHPNSDGFVMKMDSSGAPQWSTYINGWQGDTVYGITIHSDGTIYVAGEVYWLFRGEEVDYDLPGVFNQWRGGEKDGFVAKLSSAGSVLWSLLLGSSSGDGCTRVTTDSSGYVYVGGNAGAGDLNAPLTNTMGGDAASDGFVMKISSAGTVQWSTYSARWRGAGIGDIDMDIDGGILATLGTLLFKFDSATGEEQWAVGGGFNSMPYWGQTYTSLWLLHVDPASTAVTVGGTTLLALPNPTNSKDSETGDGCVLKFVFDRSVDCP
ncbi:MAG: SBBP repeat-containing protein [Phycisphaerae bacterium]|nr:SBBP repeat-containing protein [Phycisphaerae bacterium]